MESPSGFSFAYKTLRRHMDHSQSQALEPGNAHYLRWLHFMVLHTPLVSKYDPHWIHRKILRELHKHDSIETPWENGLAKIGLVDPCDALLMHTETTSQCGCVNHFTKMIQMRDAHIGGRISVGIISMARLTESLRRFEFPNHIWYDFNAGSEGKDDTWSDFDMYMLRLFANTAADTKLNHPLLQFQSWITSPFAESLIRLFSNKMLLPLTGSFNQLRNRQPPLNMTYYYPDEFERTLKLIKITPHELYKGQKIYFPHLRGVADRTVQLYASLNDICRYHELPMPGCVRDLWSEWVCKETSLMQVEVMRYQMYERNHEFKANYEFQFQCPHRAKIIMFMAYAVCKHKVKIQHLIDYLDLFLEFNGQKELIWLCPRIERLSEHMFDERKPVISLTEFFIFMRTQIL